MPYFLKFPVNFHSGGLSSPKLSEKCQIFEPLQSNHAAWQTQITKIHKQVLAIDMLINVSITTRKNARTGVDYRHSCILFPFPNGKML
jgi:hypothetical protein